MVMRRKVENKRFPHRCKVYRMTEETAFSDGEEEILYEGECRNYNNTSLRTFYESTQAGRVVRADFGVSIPLSDKSFMARSGDLLDVELPNESVKGVMISDIYIGTMGINLYYERSKT